MNANKQSKHGEQPFVLIKFLYMMYNNDMPDANTPNQKHRALFSLINCETTSLEEEKQRRHRYNHKIPSVVSLEQPSTGTTPLLVIHALDANTHFVFLPRLKLVTFPSI
mmetsp:Transcript_2166/g.4250  ORF Transcript_2166/g.4250 Transcript_2166/m.4250 type:complete len:109 (-) Transcript_2166:1930-2256(-)